MKVGTLFSGVGAPEFALRSLRVPHSIEFACDNDPFVKADTSEDRKYNDGELFEYLFKIKTL